MNALAGGRREIALALVGGGIAVVGIAFALHPLEASLLVFWVLIGLAALAALVGLVMLGIGSACKTRLKKRLARSKGPRPRLVASDCRRVSETIAELIVEQWRKRPRAKRFGGLGNQDLAAWNEETVARYDRELCAWATRVYDDAVACGVVSDSSGPLVQRPQAAQLPKLRDLFREAADTLQASSP